MKLTATIIATLLATATATARQLDIDLCQQMAHDNYPMIEQYELIEQSTGYTLSNIKKNWLPTAQLSAQATYQSDAPDFPEQFKKAFSQVLDIHGMNKDQYKIALDINQTIWDGGKTRNEKAIAEARQKESEANTDVQLYKLRATVNDLYFGILLIEASIRQNNEQATLIGNNLQQINTHLKNGTAMQCDADAVEASLLTVRQQTSQLEARRKQYASALCLLLGIGNEEISLEMPYGEISQESQNKRPELQLFDRQIELLGKQRKSLDTAIMPMFNFFANGFYGNPGLDYIENMMNPQWSWNYMIGVTMRWNIGGLYTRKNDLRKLELQEKSIYNERDVFLFNSNISANRKKEEIAEYENLVKDDDGIIELRESIRKAAETKLANGIIDVTDLLQKITEENSAKLNKAYHEIQRLKAIHELKEITNN